MPSRRIMRKTVENSRSNPDLHHPKDRLGATPPMGQVGTASITNASWPDLPVYLGERPAPLWMQAAMQLMVLGRLRPVSEREADRNDQFQFAAEVDGMVYAWTREEPGRWELVFVFNEQEQS